MSSVQKHAFGPVRKFVILLGEPAGLSWGNPAGQPAVPGL